MKHNTKEAMYITAMYKRSSDTELWQVYGNYSRAKAEAFDYCKRLMAEHDGSDLRILSHNTFMFTAAFQFRNKETDEAMIMYITPSKNKPVFWTEEDMVR